MMFSYNKIDINDIEECQIISEFDSEYIKFKKLLIERSVSRLNRDNLIQKHPKEFQDFKEMFERIIETNGSCIECLDSKTIKIGDNVANFEIMKKFIALSILNGFINYNRELNDYDIRNLALRLSYFFNLKDIVILKGSGNFPTEQFEGYIRTLGSHEARKSVVGQDASRFEAFIKKGISSFHSLNYKRVFRIKLKSGKITYKEADCILEINNNPIIIEIFNHWKHSDEKSEQVVNYGEFYKLATNKQPSLFTITGEWNYKNLRMEPVGLVSKDANDFCTKFNNEYGSINNTTDIKIGQILEGFICDKCHIFYECPPLKPICSCGGKVVFVVKN